MENTELDGTVTVEEAIRIPLNATKEEIEEALRQRYLVSPSDSVDVAIAKVKAGVTFLQGSGQSYSTGDLALNTGSSGLAAIDDMLQNALKNAEAGKSVRIFFRNVTVAGLVLDYAVDVTQETDRYGNVGYRAQLVGGVHTGFKFVGSTFVAAGIMYAFFPASILVSAAVAGVSAFAISAGYDFLAKDQIAERVRQLYDDSQHEAPAPAEPSPVTEDVPMSGSTATEGFFDSVGSFLGGVGSGIADFFGGLFGGGASGGASFMPTSSAPFGKSSGVDPLVLYGLQRQQQPLDLEKSFRKLSINMPIV